jgi:hypothetical protein
VIVDPTGLSGVRRIGLVDDAAPDFAFASSLPLARRSG